MLVIKNPVLRKLLRILIPFVLLPSVVIGGALAFGEKSWAFVILAAAVLSLLLFIAGFEKKKTGTRRLILAAVFTALSVIGRFIPLLKPVTALTVIAAMYLGGEAGFLVGSLSALVSDFYFGQGPWTPFQMLSWGLIGLLAGALSPLLKKSRALLLVFGFLSGIFYSLLMDVWTVLWYGGFELSVYAAAIAAAVPHMLLYAVSNVIFLTLLAKPFGEKLERVRLKYGV